MEIPSIKSIVSRDFVLIFFSILFFFSPGLAIIVLYIPSWLHDFDAFKILLLSVGIVTPVVSLFWGEIAMADGKSFRTAKNYDAFSDLFLSLFMTAMVIYLSLGLTQVFENWWGYPHGLKKFLLVGFVCTLIGLLVVNRLEKSERKHKQDN